MQNVWMVELAHDSGLTEEVPPLAIWGRVFQGLNSHSFAILAGEAQNPSINFPKLPWAEGKQDCDPMHHEAT